MDDGSSDDADSDNEKDELESVTIELKQWSEEYRISQTALTKLLNILQSKVASLRLLPRSSRTFLSTPTEIPTRVVSGNSYYHFGLEKELKKIVNHYEDQLDIHWWTNQYATYFIKYWWIAIVQEFTSKYLAHPLPCGHYWCCFPDYYNVRHVKTHGHRVFAGNIWWAQALSGAWNPYGW